MLAEQVVALEAAEKLYVPSRHTSLKAPVFDKLVLTMEGRFPNLRCAFPSSVIEAFLRARVSAMTLKRNGGM